MDIFTAFSDLPQHPIGTVTIGNFDGFHLGHQHLVKTLVGQARKEGRKGSLLVTFDPHPREVLNPGRLVPRLSAWEDLVQLFEAEGVDQILRLRFDRKLAETSAEEFLEALFAPTSFRHLVIGHDFALGAGRKGNAEFLKNWCAARGLQFTQVPPLEKSGVTISSQKIRDFLTQGKIKEANEFLGRRFSLSGEVVAGDRRGRTLQFPTANLKLNPALLLPALGVYAGVVMVGGNSPRFEAVANLGLRPTFHPDQKQPVLEVHILDYSEEIYGEFLRFEFSSYLRGEKKFSSKDELVEQIRRDVILARSVLNE